MRPTNSITGCSFTADCPFRLGESEMRIQSANPRPHHHLSADPDQRSHWSDRNNTVSFGVMVTMGVLLGSVVSALLRKEFHVESFRSTEDMTNHLLGGLLMGFGGVTAMRCSIGQGISSLSLQSAGACLAVAGLVGGAWLTLRLQAWRHNQAVV